MGKKLPLIGTVFFVVAADDNVPSVTLQKGQSVIA